MLCLVPEYGGLLVGAEALEQAGRNDDARTEEPEAECGGSSRRGQVQAQSRILCDRCQRLVVERLEGEGVEQPPLTVIGPERPCEGGRGNECESDEDERAQRDPLELREEED